MENAYIFRILTLCAAALAVAHGELAISVNVSKPSASLGDDVQIKCHILNKEKKQFYVVWVKKVGMHEVEIGTNMKMNKIFEDSKRYSGDVQFKVNGDISDVTFVLDIKKVEASDSGDIGCKLPKLRMVVFKELIVKVPFSSVLMSSRHIDGSHHVTYQTGDTIQFDEGERREFTCRALGGYPQPELTLSLGDDDITSEFNKTIELIKDGMAGLYSLSYDIELKDTNLEITYEYSKKTIQCRARIPGTEFTSNTSVNIQLSGYKPQFLCEEVVLMPLHQEDVNISCRVRADPPILGNLTEYYWPRTSTGNDTIMPGNSHGQITAFLEPGKDEYENVLTLHIEHLYTHHFQTYYFQATNTLGSATHGVVLQRAVTYELETEGPTSGNSYNQVPGGKDRPSSVASLSRLIPGVIFTAILMIIVL